MKKLILSAVMMMAFVGTSMAKTTVCKRTKVTSDLQIIKSCVNAADMIMIQSEALLECATGTCFTNAEYNRLWLLAYKSCMG